MTELFYDVELQTPIGKRPGMMYACILQDKVNGTLDLLKHATVFDGKIDENGCCSIQGEIISLIKAIPFHAVGRMKKEAVMLSMFTDYGEFQLTGKERQHEEILQPGR